MSSRDNFYVILSSTDSAHYSSKPNRSNFITHLAEPISVNGDWEVALTEIHLPGSWMHMTREHCQFTVQIGERKPTITVNKINIESPGLAHIRILHNTTTADSTDTAKPSIIQTVNDFLSDDRYISQDDNELKKKNKLIDYTMDKDNHSEIKFVMKPFTQLLIPTEIPDYIAQLFGVEAKTPTTAIYHGTVKEFPNSTAKKVYLIPSKITAEPTQWTVNIETLATKLRIANLKPAVKKEGAGDTERNAEEFTIFFAHSVNSLPYIAVTTQLASEPITHQLTIPLINYDSAEALVGAVNEVLGKNHNFGDKIKLSIVNDRATVSFTNNENKGNNNKLTLLPTYNRDYYHGSLGELLGFDQDKILNGITANYTGTNPIRITNQLTAFYVHCDLINDVLIGSQKANIIRVITDLKDKVYHVFESPYYFDLIRNNTPTIEIAVLTDTGNAVEFIGGKTVAYLHFRRKYKKIKK